jgi:hypothetical protein
MDVRQLLIKEEDQRDSVPEHLVGVPRFSDLCREVITLVRGDTLSLRVDVECELPVRFQWYFGSLTMGKEEPLAGQTKNLLSFVTNLKTPTGYYRCRAFSDRCPQGARSKWFFVRMERRRMGPQKRFFVQVKRS